MLSEHEKAKTWGQLGFFLRKLITIITPSPYRSKIWTVPVTERGDSHFSSFFFSSVIHTHTHTQWSENNQSVPRAWSCYAVAWFHCCTKCVCLYIFVLRVLAARKELQVSFYLLSQVYNFFQLYLFLVLVINSEITFSCHWCPISHPIKLPLSTSMN